MKLVFMEGFFGQVYRLYVKCFILDFQSNVQLCYMYINVVLFAFYSSVEFRFAVAQLQYNVCI